MLWQSTLKQWIFMNTQKLFEECNFSHLLFVLEKSHFTWIAPFFQGPLNPCQLPFFDLSSLWTWSHVKVPPKKDTDSIFKRSNRNFLQCYLVRIASFEFYISKLFYFHFHVKWPFNVANWQSEILSESPSKMSMCLQNLIYPFFSARTLQVWIHQCGIFR